MGKKVESYVKIPADAEFKAGDAKKAAGLSYRQLNDWDQKGALAGERASESGWRKFSPRELFAVLICAEIRKRFGVPVESLNWIKSLEH